MLPKIQKGGVVNVGARKFKHAEREGFRNIFCKGDKEE
jgi:hypothetical protein